MSLQFFSSDKHAYIVNMHNASADPLDILLKEEIVEKLIYCFNKLRERERVVLNLRVSGDGLKYLAYNKIGKHMGVSTERARQLCFLGIERLKAHIEKDYLSCTPPLRAMGQSQLFV